jgi:CBS domain containing-hemolysin-like protein
MSDYIYSLILLLVALTAIELRKSYYLVPKIELKRRAREGDELAEKLYRAVSFESSLDIFLWMVIVLCTAGSLILFNQVAPLWLDIITVIIFIWLVFAWLPRLAVNNFSLKLTGYITPVIVWVLNLIHPYLQKINHHKGKPDSETHSGLYDKKDLINLISKQKKQLDNRIDPSDLELIKKALKFKDKTVGEYGLTWSKAEKMFASDSIGPVMLDEMHKSGQLFVPVLADNESKKLVGMIDLSRIDLSTAGTARDLMNQNLYYLNEDDSLYDALNALSTTGHPVFIVLDKKQRPFGLLTIKDVIKELYSFKPTHDENIIKPGNEETSNS